MKNSGQKKGNNLELRTAAYFQAHGYIVRRAVTLSVAAGTADATDIDLLGIRFSVPLAEEKLIADCRDRKKPRTFARILWTLGLASFSKADRSVVVTSRAPWQAREFASTSTHGIEILGTIDIDTFLDSVKDSFHSFGEADSITAQQFFLAKKGSSDKKLLRKDLMLRQMLVIGHPITNLNRIIKILSYVGKFSDKSTKEPDWLKRYICFNAAVLAGIMLVRFAVESKWTPENEWTNYALKKLTYGDVPPQKARQLAKLALDNIFTKELPTPEYSDEIINVIKFLISNPYIATLTPYALDFHLLGHILGSLPDDYVSPILGTFQEDTIKVCKKVLSVLSYAAEVSVDLWKPQTSIEIANNKRKSQSRF